MVGSEKNREQLFAENEKLHSKIVDADCNGRFNDLI